MPLLSLTFLMLFVLPRNGLVEVYYPAENYAVQHPYL